MFRFLNFRLRFKHMSDSRSSDSKRDEKPSLADDIDAKHNSVAARRVISYANIESKSAEPEKEEKVIQEKIIDEMIKLAGTGPKANPTLLAILLDPNNKKTMDAWHFPVNEAPKEIPVDDLVKNLAKDLYNQLYQDLERLSKEVDSFCRKPVLPVAVPVGKSTKLKDVGEYFSTWIKNRLGMDDKVPSDVGVLKYFYNRFKDFFTLNVFGMSRQGDAIINYNVKYPVLQQQLLLNRDSVVKPLIMFSANRRWKKPSSKTEAIVTFKEMLQTRLMPSSSSREGCVSAMSSLGFSAGNEQDKVFAEICLNRNIETIRILGRRPLLLSLLLRERQTLQKVLADNKESVKDYIDLSMALGGAFDLHQTQSQISAEEEKRKRARDNKLLFDEKKSLFEKNDSLARRIKNCGLKITNNEKNKLFSENHYVWMLEQAEKEQNSQLVKAIEAQEIYLKKFFARADMELHKKIGFIWDEFKKNSDNAVIKLKRWEKLKKDFSVSSVALSKEKNIVRSMINGSFHDTIFQNFLLLNIQDIEKVIKNLNGSNEDIKNAYEKLGLDAEQTLNILRQMNEHEPSISTSVSLQSTQIDHGNRSRTSSVDRSLTNFIGTGGSTNHSSNGQPGVFFEDHHISSQDLFVSFEVSHSSPIKMDESEFMDSLQNTKPTLVSAGSTEEEEGEGTSEGLKPGECIFYSVDKLSLNKEVLMTRASQQTANDYCYVERCTNTNGYQTFLLNSPVNNNMSRIFATLLARYKNIDIEKVMGALKQQIKFEKPISRDMLLQALKKISGLNANLLADQLFNAYTNAHLSFAYQLCASLRKNSKNQTIIIEEIGDPVFSKACARICQLKGWKYEDNSNKNFDKLFENCQIKLPETTIKSTSQPISQARRGGHH